MASGLKIGMALVVIGALGVGGNIYKNNVIASKIETALNKELKVENTLSFTNVKCSGLAQVDCKINNIKLKLDKNGGIIADSFIIKDIAQWQKFDGVDAKNSMQVENLLLDSIKNGISLSIGIENLNIYNTTYDKQKLKDDILKEFSKDKQSKKLVKEMMDKLDNQGLSGSLLLKITNNKIVVQEVVTTALSNSTLKATIAYEGDKINTKDDIEAVAQNAIFKEINLDINNISNSTLSGLYLFYKQLAYSHKRSDKRAIEFLNKQYSLNTDGKNLDFNDFKKALASDTTAKLIDKNVAQLTSELKSKLKDKVIYTVIDDISSKIKSLAKGDDKISISIKSELSAKKVENEVLNMMFKGKTTKPLDQLITLKIQ
jgi:hypothetical protein